MEAGFKGKPSESSCPDISFANQNVQRCPFLRNIHEPTNFSFSPINFSIPTFPWTKWSGSTLRKDICAWEEPEPEISSEFNPLAAKAATISLSAFGPGGPFGFDFFSKKWKKQNGRSSNSQTCIVLQYSYNAAICLAVRDYVSSISLKTGGDSVHESWSNEWLETGQCPIAKSYRAVSGVLPLVADVLRSPPGIKLRCPPVVVAARAVLARTSFVKNLRPQPLPAKMVAIALLGMAANVPLGVWREHTKKFSPQWVIAIHAAVPFIAMLRKSVLMPKAAMAITIAASILGQTIGSRAERIRLKAVAAAAANEGSHLILKTRAVTYAQKIGQCGPEVEWDPLSLKAGKKRSSIKDMASLMVELEVCKAELERSIPKEKASLMMKLGVDKAKVQRSANKRVGVGNDKAELLVYLG
ncbi:hypothetical protein ZIOFF_003712 [Zingiber officinale]|uniref:Uncharacterized protein n=1 Tax=Zingiber officinale TaxID=94328 RepID=A0A8J5IA02_ZINOF|nr:hypothetical protein ZIOFF_003712 [Zingiber officinale]